MDFSFSISAKKSKFEFTTLVSTILIIIRSTLPTFSGVLALMTIIKTGLLPMKGESPVCWEARLPTREE